MPVSIVYSFCGPTVSPSISTVATGQVTVNSFPSNPANHAAFLNTGPTLIAVSLGRGSSAPTPVFPSGSVTDAPVFILPPNMQDPMIVVTPPTPFNFNALTNSSVPPTLFVTPVIGV